jgi:hypothetical protein
MTRRCREKYCYYPLFQLKLDSKLSLNKKKIVCEEVLYFCKKYKRNNTRFPFLI